MTSTEIGQADGHSIADRLRQFLLSESRLFGSLEYRGSILVTRDLAGAEVRFNFREGDLEKSVDLLGASARNIWPEIDGEEGAFRLLAVHMAEAVELADVEPLYGKSREYHLMDGLLCAVN